MARRVIRDAFVRIIENQLDNELSPATSLHYQKLLDLDLSEESSKESLAYFYEVYLRQNPQHSEGFKEEDWLSFLNQVPIHTHFGEYSFTTVEAKKNIRQIQKRFGSLKKNTRLFEKELFSIESYLVVLNAAFQTSSLDVQKVIHIVINRLLDLETHDTSDYSGYASEDLLYMADGLEEICNPFINQEIEKILKPYVNIHDDRNYEYIFKNVLICLTRILDSISFWDKEFGKDGYFRYIQQFINADQIINHGPIIFFNDQTLQKDINNL